MLASPSRQELGSPARYHRLQKIGRAVGYQVDAAVAALAVADGLLSEGSSVSPAKDASAEQVVPKEEAQPVVGDDKKTERRVVRVKAKIATPYCSYGWRRRREASSNENAFFSVVNDGEVYKTPEEKERAAVREGKAHWLGEKTFVPSGIASPIPLRKAGGVAHDGPFFDDVILEKICRVDDKSKFLCTAGWRPIADRRQVSVPPPR
mmetsp:Transcript_23217/g.71391  ORF Transcript_23217/g.71391 Transcript_23217/m.71391 type:complete len:207 (-) Transcript_23217:1117-1737(-)